MNFVPKSGPLPYKPARSAFWPDSAMKIARLPNGSPEIFRTLQGEGPSMGCPAVFLRLSLCNLHCHWCDTPFTWNWTGTPWEHQDGKKFSKEEQIRELEPAEIAKALAEEARAGDHLVITGGEPLLQQEGLAALLTLAGDLFASIEIETNGTQTPTAELDRWVSQFNVSPKLANSNNAPELRLKQAPLAFFATSEKAFFKFVVQSQEDITEVLALAEEYGISARKILLMPEGRTPAELAANRDWIANLCLKHGLRMTDRLHVQLWGDARGR